MARARRSRSRGRATKTPGDWVYRGGITDNEGSQAFEHATYAPATFGLNQGESTGHVLYDSANYMKALLGNSNVANSAARAAGKRPKTFRVKGQITWEASVWATGDELQMGFRIGVFQQDPLDGILLAPATYSMMSTTGSMAFNPDVWANIRRNNLWEHRNYQHFATGNESSRRTLYINTPAKAMLGSDECLAIYIEMSNASESMRYQLWLATYVSDESSG